MADNEFHYNDKITTQQNHSLASNSGKVLFLVCYVHIFISVCYAFLATLVIVDGKSAIYPLYKWRWSDVHPDFSHNCHAGVVAYHLVDDLYFEMLLCY